MVRHLQVRRSKITSYIAQDTITSLRRVMQLAARQSPQDNTVCLTGGTDTTSYREKQLCLSTVRSLDNGSIATITTSIPKMVFEDGQEKMLVLRQLEIKLLRGSKQYFHNNFEWFRGFKVKLHADCFE